MFRKRPIPVAVIWAYLFNIPPQYIPRMTYSRWAAVWWEEENLIVCGEKWRETFQELSLAQSLHSDSRLGRENKRLRCGKISFITDVKKNEIDWDHSDPSRSTKIHMLSIILFGQLGNNGKKINSGLRIKIKCEKHQVSWGIKTEHITPAQSQDDWWTEKQSLKGNAHRSGRKGAANWILLAEPGTTSGIGRCSGNKEKRGKKKTQKKQK